MVQFSVRKEQKYLILLTEAKPTFRWEASTVIDSRRSPLMTSSSRDRISKPRLRWRTLSARTHDEVEVPHQHADTRPVTLIRKTRALSAEDDLYRRLSGITPIVDRLPEGYSFKEKNYYVFIA